MRRALPALALPLVLGCPGGDVAVPASSMELVDADGDGWAAGLDCNDQHPAIHPGAPEACDEVDADCDGVVDDHPVDGTAAWADRDADGWGDAATEGTVCGAAFGWAAWPGDCDDLDAFANPSMQESCATERDDDCDGATNEPGASGCTPHHEDVDGDGVGGDASWCLCAPEGNYTATVGGDCDDLDAGRSAGCGLLGSGTLTDEAWLLVGEAQAQAGIAVLSAGDTDGDGVRDVLIVGSRVAALVEGPIVADGDLGAAAARYAWTASEPFGGVAAGADLDGDGLPDVAVARADAGAEIAVLSGAWRGDVAVPEDAGFRTVVQGSGASPSGLAAGDLTGDGAADLALVATGGVYVWAGPMGRADLPAQDALVAGSCLTAPAAPADLDGDGVGDLALGAPCGAGGAVVLSGPLVDGASTADGTWLYGAEEDLSAGYGVAVPGDLDGDGHADLVVGARAGCYDVDEPRYLVAAGPPAPDGLAAPLATFHVPTESAAFAAAGLGDADGDGRDDLAVGHTAAGSAYEGAALVFPGPVAGALGTDDAWIHGGGVAYGFAGAAIAGPGDVTGDGAPDLLVGAYGLQLGGSSSGGAWLLPGTPAAEAP